MPVKNDEGLVGKVVVGLAVLVGGVVTVLAFWKWKQSKQSGGSAEQGKPTGAAAVKPPAAATGPVAAPPASKPSPTAGPAAAVAPPVNKPTPAATPTSSSAAPAAVKPSAASSQPAAPSKPSPAVSKPAEAAAGQPGTGVQQPPASTLRDAPKSELKMSAPPALSSVGGGRPPASLSGNNSDNNGSDLSMSATFEKVSAEPSLTLSSMSSMSASFTSGTTTPPAAGAVTPPRMGGPKSADLDCDWSRESPVFGGQPVSLLDESETDLSSFDPSTQHPAFFGFKFDGPTS